MIRSHRKTEEDKDVLDKGRFVPVDPSSSVLGGYRIADNNHALVDGARNGWVWVEIHILLGFARFVQNALVPDKESFGQRASRLLAKYWLG